jgi:hypothetical protein
LKVVLDTNRQLSVFWKGSEILSNYQTAYFPSAGRLVFAGRTGGSWQNQQVDNIKVTTIPAALALVGQVKGTPSDFRWTSLIRATAWWIPPSRSHSSSTATR